MLYLIDFNCFYFQGSNLSMMIQYDYYDGDDLVYLFCCECCFLNLFCNTVVFISNKIDKLSFYVVEYLRDKYVIVAGGNGYLR